LTIQSADIMHIPESEIPKTRCLITVIGGEVVFDAAHASAGRAGDPGRQQ
jgi:predicted amidohydrolase YtcJ